MLEHEKNVIGFEIGLVEKDTIDRVIESCYNKIRELNAQIEFGS